MELEMHSPTFSPMRTGPTLKRSRSPSPTLSDRPAKRAALALVGHLQLPPRPAPVTAPDIHAPQESGCTQRSPEDLVSQTRLANLRLDSPGLNAGDFQLPTEQASADECMEADTQLTPMDGDVSMSQEKIPRPSCPSIRISTSASSLATPSASDPSPQPLVLPHVSRPSSLHPLICIQPATPSTPSASSISPSPSSTTQPHSRSPWGTARSVSPAHMYFSASPPGPINSPGHTHPSPTASTNGPRKVLRFSMGPRADCEKCRQGLKGHSVHLD
ncbi:hypothetical protein PUNSTDRAFT_139570 [Punctularia strigosozonata HHB-11173 SS5]|uniref:Uncharacterized protein n=1 Tax=Punctularia strigosozonata (strain HHB-11173) TaxID=741275 RepID=R7S0U2_PUNST|nr:uncharacterized protein PUNSTDRAFT_139570 [Punctularia strigosozonata HHB-11173 SS5]EIN03417.1 hypothetical protein PUNSTDRAFT_139570 [Punctularia strigosozonata HHB-11173 SS5]